MADKVFITGAAGLVGQNLIPSLKTEGFEIIAADKHSDNLKVLRDMHPDIETVEADLSQPGDWEDLLAQSDLAVLLHAQIGGLDESEFNRNNITATERCLKIIKTGKVRFTVHVSSSVVNSMADDFYTRSKTAQEEVVLASDIRCCVLRPTLMFGWFDRKHLGWLKRFMEKAPVFPIPGNGRYLRQPLYGGDFSAVVGAALQREIEGTYNISGQERIDYIDLIKAIRSVNALNTPVLNIPYWMFWTLLRTYAVFDSNPPFTTHQLKALVTPDVFEVIDWPEIFDVAATPLDEALRQTFKHPVYSSVELKF